MNKYVKISLKDYNTLLKKEYIIKVMLAVSKDNETNQLETRNLSLINSLLAMFKNNCEDFMEGEKDG